jgi:hypothetical protein
MFILLLFPVILSACQSGHYRTLVVLLTIAKEDREDNAGLGYFVEQALSKRYQL